MIIMGNNEIYLDMAAENGPCIDYLPIKMIITRT